jgi:curli biogenesis system outer membrane secretion channel CsgG
LSIINASCVSIAPSDKSVNLVQGPQITDVKTPFDEALSCLSGKISPKVTFSVGAISDATGKEQFTEGGTGKFITQGAGDIVQSALFNAGVNVLNRRDPRVFEAEVKWGIRNSSKIIPSRYFITGSINSLDFIPGAGFDAQINGLGPRYRQFRILVGLDLSVTDSSTGRIVANSAIQKQIFADELGVGIGRFFGNVLVNLDASNMRREATSLAMRQMLNLATYDLLTQLMRADNYVTCSEQIKEFHEVSLSKAWRQEVSRASKAKLEEKENGEHEQHPHTKPESSKNKSEAEISSEDDKSDETSEKQENKSETQSVNTIVKPEPPSGSGPEIESLIRSYDIR